MLVLAHRTVRRRNLSEAGGAPYVGLGHMPTARMDERLVIPAHRHQPIKVLADREAVRFKRRPGILMADLHSFADRRDAASDVRRAIYVHEAVRAVASNTEQTARPVKFEA